MIELVRTNDPVLISWLLAALAAEGIEAAVFDAHTSILEGSIAAIPRRVMVDEATLSRARAILSAADALRAGDTEAS